MEEFLLKFDLWNADIAVKNKEFLLNHCAYFKDAVYSRAEFDSDIFFIDLTFSNRLRELSMCIAPMFDDVSLSITTVRGVQASIWMNYIKYIEIYKDKALFFEGIHRANNNVKDEQISVIECDLINLTIKSRLNLASYNTKMTGLST
ncbi:hypothetical protein [Bartonella sp. HY761]|uniref:hypothetical protein n=1 Tax=Bartonella sp. HY761 TaxID=2979330 RepID=UPI002204C055|nr:hypothetical protein [Bartonella sp. HY761]UXN05682.1 hypothetical protein N6A79_10305 [Bartonella sp. HY761]